MSEPNSYHGHIGHFITKCKECQKVIAQCRCMAHKPTYWSVCDECKAKHEASEP